MIEHFIGAIRDLLQPSKDLDLLDLYCGAGLFAICFSKDYEAAIGIEESEDAIRFARENAESNGAANIQFSVGKAEELLSKLVLQNRKLHVVVDPPRVGMKKEAVEMLLKMSNIERLVYVSCHPATLIRDLKLLSERFRVEKVQPVDMFPQTKHLEVITLLSPFC